MRLYHILIVVFSLLIFRPNFSSAQILAPIGDAEIENVIYQTGIDYRNRARNDFKGKPNATVILNQSFKILRTGSSDRYLLAVIYEPNNSQIEGLQSQCEILDYSADRKFSSKILSVGLSDYGICEGFDAVGIINNKEHIAIGIGVIVRMAYGSSAVEQRTPFFLRYDRASAKLILEDKTSRELQNTVGLNSLSKISIALR